MPGFWCFFWGIGCLINEKAMDLSLGVLPTHSQVPTHLQLGWAKLPVTVLCTWLLTSPVSFLLKPRRALTDLPFISNAIMDIYECVAKCFYQTSSLNIHVSFLSAF